MIDQTIHVMDSNETASEAVANYAGAAFMMGAAVIALGIGIGIIKGSICSFRKKPVEKTDNIFDLAQEELRRRAAPVREAASPVVDKVHDIFSGSKGRTGTSSDITQVESDVEKLYYVKSSYKGAVASGEFIPETSVVEKPGAMTMEQFMTMKNHKFKSKTVLVVDKGPSMVQIQEVLNTEPPKQV